MTEKLTCPKCGSEDIEEDDCFDTYHDENSTVKECYCGHCEACGADLLWNVVYKFIGYADIEEES